jgi:hypothetical protein
LGIFAPIAWNLAGVLQEVLDLLELLDRLVRAGNIGERRLGHVLADQLGLRLAEAHDLVAATLHLVHEEEQQQDHQGERQAG